MIRYLSLSEVLQLHARIVSDSGGAAGLRDVGALESALAQPRQTFGGQDLYPTLVAKACALGFSLVMNHPFIDGNKRIGHAALEATLMLNGFELAASVDAAEVEILALASGDRSREEFTSWVEAHLIPFRERPAT